MAWPFTKVQKENVFHLMVCGTGRVFVFGGGDVNGNVLSSVEMREQSLGLGWQTLPTPMFAADAYFESVSQP